MFYGDEATKAGYAYICWSVILIDSAFKKDESNYPQEFSKEYKYLENKRAD